MIEIIPTNTCPPDLKELERRSREFAEYARDVQLDVDDGIFAPALSWPYLNGQWDELERMAVDRAALPLTDQLKYEVHLMVQEPARIGELLARVGCKRIIAHIETFENASVTDAFFAWKSAGASEVGLAILIDTPLSMLIPHIEKCDVVQMMSIAKLGSQGAAYEPRVIDRIAELHAQYPRLTIGIDGGVSESNIADLVRAGATRFGVGSALSKADNPKSAYKKLQALAESATER